MVLSQTAIPLQRVRYCGHCKAYVKGFDHHCPAFGNCIGMVCWSPTHRSHVGYEIIGDTSPYFHPCKSNSCMGKLCFLLLDIKLQFIFVTYGPFCLGGCWSWYYFNPGQKNRVLFIILLAGFVFTEASYVASSAQCKPEFFMPKYICEVVYCKNRKSLFCCSALDHIG